MNNLAKRSLVGFPGAALMVFLIFFNEVTFTLLFFVIAMLSLYEFYSRAKSETIRPQIITGLLTGLAVFMVIVSRKFFLVNFFTSVNGIFLVLLLTYLIFILELWRKAQQPFTNIAITLLGIIYLPLTMGIAVLLGWSSDDGQFHPSNMFGYFFIVWAHDIGAYSSGKWFGKHKLFERISPKKTWEGSIGGTILAFVVAHFIAMYCPGFSKLTWLAITGIIIVTGTLGDLVKSMFKRSIGIKDSGTILPGHGGMLDRFDALFISVPFVYVFLEMT